MAAFARETRLSETTFVQSSNAEGADYRNRIFTIAGEIPFAGHPSLGTAAVVAAARGERETTYVQETGAGLQPIDVRLGEDGGQASMLQEPATFGPEVDWGEVAWLSNTTARQALALALTGMMEDGEIDRARAMELARMVLHDNAVKLYGMK